MKLYILTSTLNFVSIMASESCSPYACYARRRFGSSYFYKAGSFAKDNSIVMFDRYPKFSMPKTEEEQYPLVIEIETDKVANFEYSRVGSVNNVNIYQTCKTIYLNPVGCRILFESDTVRNQIVNRTKTRSIEAKMLFYMESGCLCTSDALPFAYGKEYVDHYPDMDFDEENLLRDEQINKCKGFLFAYLIGANTSPAEGVSSLQQILKELTNLIHARIVNEDFRYHADRIDELQDEFVEIAHNYDNVYKELVESANRMNGSSVEMLQCELKRLGLWEHVANRLFSLPNRLSEIRSSEEFTCVENSMKNFIASISLENKMLIDEIPSIYEYKPTAIPLRVSNQEIGIYTEWIKILLEPDRNLNDYFENRLQYLKDLGSKAKCIIGDERFKDSSEREYYNGLVRNIQKAEDFEVDSLDSFVWQSFALFFMSTNPDVEKLYSLMVNFAVEDYRCAVAMWGALCGYADMPKTFFDKVAEGVSIEEAYNYVSCIAKKILGFDSGGFVSNEVQTDVVWQMPTDAVEDIVKKYLSEYDQKNHRKMSKDQKLSVEKALARTHNGTIMDFLMVLNDYPGFKRRSPKSFWTYLKEHACPEYDEETTPNIIKIKSNDKHIDILPLFDNELGPNIEAEQGPCAYGKDEGSYNSRSDLFVDDKNAKVFIENQSYLPSNVRRILCKMIVSFQENYAPGGYYVKNNKSRTNNNTIEHFINKCTYDNGGKKKPLIPKTSENGRLLEKLKADLQSRYEDRQDTNNK